MDEPDWKWNTLVDQPRELNDRGKSLLIINLISTDLVVPIEWNSIRPELEKTIELRREKKAYAERMKCLNKRKENISLLARSILQSSEGSRANLSFHELIRLPVIKEFIGAEGHVTIISAEVAWYIRYAMLEIGGARTRALEEKCLSEMYNILSKLEILPSIFDSTSSLRDPVRLLNCSYAIFTDGTCTRSFSGILESMHNHTERSYINLAYRELEARALYENLLGDQPDERSITTAKELADMPKNEHPSIMSMELLRSSKFLCQRCSLGRKYDWLEIVS